MIRPGYQLRSHAMNLSLFQKIIKDFQIRLLPSLTQRDLKLSFIKDMSLTIVGARRGGKTYRTFQLLHDLARQEVRKENVCRIQFNDHRLRSISIDHLHLIDEAFYSLYPAKQMKGRFLSVPNVTKLSLHG